jgi:ATP-GRASP peptide maturase of grasp-with-spasm system
MILIQTISNDFSSSSVIQWLCDANQKFIRLNDRSIISAVSFSENGFKIKVDAQIINSDEIKSYWYRRGCFGVDSYLGNDFLEIVYPFYSYLQGENDTFINFIDYYLSKNIPSIGNQSNNSINKLIACQIARKNNIKVPDFLITTSKNELLKFYKKHNQIISKSIYGLPGFSSENKHYSLATKNITITDIENYPDDFGISLFQEYIEKKVELRVFFLNDNFYASAIFSQNDAQTKIDFRNYNMEKPNRVVPYKLPIEIKEKLKTLNKELSLSTGSYDIILTPENEYYFLEVNPIGQFAQVSTPCNYYLETIIAT